MPHQSLPCLGVILRANRNIGSGHLMRVKPLLPLLKPYFSLHLYVYAFDENLRPMTQDYDAVSVFNTKEDILQHLLTLPYKTQTTASTLRQENSSLGLKPDDCTPCPTSTKLATLAYDSARTSSTDELTKLQNHKVQSQEMLPDVLLIDDYAIDRNFECCLYERTKIMVIDGLYNRPHTCHKLLDITLYPDFSYQQYKKLCNAECKILAGSQYSLTAQRFSPSFFVPYHPQCSCSGHYGGYSGRMQRPSSTANATGCICQDTQAQPLPRVFISFGGADPVSASLILTKTILRAQLYEQYRFTLVAGMSNSDYPEIEKLLQQHLPVNFQNNFILIKQCSDIADLLFRNDLAIGAYGGMTFERVTARIPTLGVVIADNQLNYRETCDEFKFGLSLELEDLSDAAKVKQALRELMDNAQTFTENCAHVYDGHGLEHIAQEVISMLD